MGITIPEHESELCAKLMRPSWIAAGLTNDLFSWEKEYDAAIRNGHPDVANAIWVLMGEHSITAEEAKLLCREKIKVAVADYLKIIEENRNNPEISLDLRRYIEAMQYSLSGNVVWSLQCPRYHPEAQYNQLQLLRMEHGLAAYSGPKLNLKTKRTDDSICREGPERPPKRARPNGLSTPPSPAMDKFEDLDGSQKNIQEEWSSADLGSPIEKGSDGADEDIAVKLDIPEIGEDVSEIATEAPAQRNTDRLVCRQVVNAPYDYLTSLPSKGVRDQFIDAFNVWLHVPADSTAIIKKIGNRLHNASLM